jgi:L-asparaginase/Glu-tRNA(Gln) amidotransferase subunit D
MKKKLIVGAVALGLGLTSFGAGSASASAAGGNGKCVAAGVGVLRTLPGGVAGVARGGLEFGGAQLSLSQVITAHTTNPELFPWCN